MSWTGTSLMLMAFEVYGSERVAEVDLGKLSHITFLSLYIRPEAGKLGHAQLGRRIDDGLVELIWLDILDDERGVVDYEEIHAGLLELAEGMRELPALREFEKVLREKEAVPLAGETYLGLAMRHISRKTGRGIPYDRRLPSPTEAANFARVMLAHFMNKEFLKKDWGRNGWDRQVS